MAEIATLAIPAIVSAGASYGASQLTQQAPPKPQPVAPRPDPNDPAIQEERRRKLAEEQARSGRAATDLTGSGTQSYSNSLLGA